MSKQDARAAIPSLDALVEEAGSRFADLPRELLVSRARALVAAMRSGDKPAGDLNHCLLALSQDLRELKRPSLQRVINLTGVLLHTNLGRAPLGKRALLGMAEDLAGYCNLEMDLETGTRSHRENHLGELLACLFPDTASLVVNNNAAAIFLAVSHWCSGREVLVSRGELPEIGGSFRITGILERAGAKVVEVGSTNRTRVADYHRGISEKTAMILKVHMANYRIDGYTEEAPVDELSHLADEHNIPLLHDLGSGMLDAGPAADWPLPLETEAREALKHCDMVTFSGDKLLGGPQAGFLVGGRRWVDPLYRDSLYRALRVDKQDLYLLQRLLRQRLGLESTPTPLQTMAALDEELLLERCGRWLDFLQGLGFEVSLGTGEAVMGGGTSPGQERPDPELLVNFPGLSPQALSQRLRQLAVPVVARVQEGSVRWNLRTLLPEDEEQLGHQLTEASFAP